MNTFARVTLCAAIPLLSSCQTEKAQVSPRTTTAIERTVYIDAICASGKAILISHNDILTLETAEAIGDHNNDLWCHCPEKRPATFDASVCRV